MTHVQYAPHTRVRDKQAIEGITMMVFEFGLNVSTFDRDRQNCQQEICDSPNERVAVDDRFTSYTRRNHPTEHRSPERYG